MSPKQQLNLFPLHPESKYDEQVVSDQVAFLLETGTETSTSLQGILDVDSGNTTTSNSEVPGAEGQYDHHQKLVKKAMKRKERDASEDRWVSYWEVVEKKLDQEEVSSCSSVGGGGLVGLKLDYQHILNVWSDKGSLFINHGPQTVPDLLLHSISNSNGTEEGNIWKVPELEKAGKREASVLRYKEKRQSRLFSKRIRYQVRKLNAEKRPRLKGRFVKRNGED
ncbi:B-box type zinc finger protein with CCT domain [Euphorbia peplus]|nr:B-box type zinc finger protein with CCT domain [Euphorbia peplus]